MERLFFREKIRQDYNHLEEGAMLDRQKFVVGVTGIGAGAGATFTAMGLAFRLGEMTSGVTYLEGQPHRDRGCGRSLLGGPLTWELRPNLRAGLQLHVGFSSPLPQES